MKVAIVHDDLMRRGGAEQVVLSMLKAFPNADLFTLCYRSHLTYPEFKGRTIFTSAYNAIATNERRMKMFFFPLGIMAMKFLRVTGYDVVIISNTYCAKYVSVDKKSKIFIYTYTPFRLAWNPTSYQEYQLSNGLRRHVFDLVISVLRRIDRAESKKGHFHLSMTEETKQRVIRAYQVDDVEIIHPPVKCSNFFVQDNPRCDYYLIVSRLEYYKNVHLAINAFNSLGYRLVIVGNGSKRKDLESMAKSNIQFKKDLSSAELADLYSNCKALVFPQHEDYGITPLEANASGRPVIAYGDGGVLETMLPFTEQSRPFTAVFFKDQTEESLVSAIKIFDNLAVDPTFIRTHAEKFDETRFIRLLTAFVRNKFNTA
jgi:glycosyltransferase involved in cell wall biosynthesis